MDSYLHPILTPDYLPPHNDIATWDTFWLADPHLSYGHHSWLSLHWGYSTNLVNFTYPGAHKAWFDSHQHAAYLHMLHTSDIKVEVGVFVWTGDFIDLDQLLKYIHTSCVSPATIPGASWDTLHIGLKVKAFPELEAP